MSYKFYGAKEVAEVENVRLIDTANEQNEETEKAIEGAALTEEAISTLREGEEKLEEATQELLEAINSKAPTQPIGDVENESESVSEDCSEFLSSSDVRLLQQAHCLSDGDTSDCNLPESK